MSLSRQSRLRGNAIKGQIIWHRVTVTMITSECTLDFLKKLISRSEVAPNRLVVDQSDVANTHNINTFLIGDEFLEELVEKSVIQRIVGDHPPE